MNDRVIVPKVELETVSGDIISTHRDGDSVLLSANGSEIQLTLSEARRTAERLIECVSATLSTEGKQC